MTDFLIYDLKVAAWIAVFYMFYRLMLSRETFHRVNRIVLLATAVVSFVLPFCVITLHETVVMPAPQASVEVGNMVAEVAEPVVPLWQSLLPYLFTIGVVITLGHTLWSIFRIMRLIKKSEQHPQADGIVVCVTGNAQMSPFSWMHYIVMNRRDYEEQDAAILAHERGHIRLRHSWDVVLVDMLTALQWFNPAMWMLRMDLRAIHEYEADAAVLSQGINARQYQYLLVTKAAGIGGYSIANGISHSTLKNRITMMLHKKSQKSHLLKLLVLLPIVAVALALNAQTVKDVVYTSADKDSHEVVVVESAVQDAAAPIAVDEGAAEAKTVKVKGQVVSVDDGKPIIGAVVQVAGSKRGAVTDTEGKFAIEAPVGAKVNVLYVGYKTEMFVVSSDEGKYNTLISLQKEGEAQVFDVVEEMPEYPGGISAMMQYLSANVKYPEEAHKKGVQGRVIVTFVVGKDGSISDAKLMRRVDPLLDAEALRVTNSMPKWKPGRQNGKPVAVKYTIPVTFKLNSSEKKDESYILKIDGKVVDDSLISSIPAGDVESMSIEKGENGKPKTMEKEKRKLIWFSALLLLPLHAQNEYYK